jgi:hypothetical protein
MHHTKRRFFASLCSFFVALMFCTIVANGQTITGRISGTVKDTSSAILPGVTVAITNEATQITRTAMTDEEGFYVITNLPPGDYTVAVEHGGFKKVLKKGNVLVADGRVTVDATLEAGQVSETITVTSAAGETVNTTSGEIARVVDGAQVVDMALNGRNFLQLATLIPGVPLLNFDAIEQTTDAGGAIAVNGSRGDSNNLTVDGGFNLLKANNSAPSNNVGVDFIQEIKIQTTNFSAEHGRQSGAAINVTTRGGGNELHGSVFEFLRNDKLDARNFFATDVRKLRFNDFGYVIGGPIIKNKFFFFGGQEWKYIRRTLDPMRRTMPTTADLSGDFSYRLRGADGIVGTRDDGVLRDPTKTGTCSMTNRTACFPGNIIPSDRITADGHALARAYLAMAQQASVFTDMPMGNNAIFELSGPFDYRQDIIRLDYKLNVAHAISGRYLHDHNWRQNMSEPLPSLVTDRLRPTYSGMLTHTWTVRPTLINEARFNISNVFIDNIPVGDLWRRDTYGFVYPQLFEDGRYNEGIPDVNLSGFAALTGPSGSNTANAYDAAITNTLTWVRAAHTLKAGAVYNRTINNQTGVVTSFYTGTITFNASGNPRSTGNAIADMLLGNFRNYSEASAPPEKPYRSTQVDAFISDNWKLHPRLSVEVGARYTYMGALYSQNDNIAAFDPQRYDPARAVTVNRDGTLVSGSGDPFNGMAMAGVDGVPRGHFPSPHRVAPRFSFAYAPFNHSRTAVRGGFGIFNNIWRGDITQRSSENPPFSGQAQYENQNLSNINQAAPHGALFTPDPRLEPSYTMNFSLSVQQELRQGIFVEAAYVGSLGRHLLRRPDINQPLFDDLRANNALPQAQRATTNFLRPFKGYSQINQYISDSNSNYNALQLHATRRKGAVVFTVSYTWSKALTDASGFDDSPEDFQDRRYNYGPASFDRRHVFVTTYTYSLPRVNNWGRIAKTVLSLWEVSGITRYQSGNQFTVNWNSAIGTRRVDYLGGEIELAKDERTVDRWFNTEAFATAPASRRGTSSVRNVPGPGLQLWDLSLRKRFALSERWRLQFQADFFNLFNKANFLNVATNLSDANFGTITSAAPGRNIQLGLRLTF